MKDLWEAEWRETCLRVDVIFPQGMYLQRLYRPAKFSSPRTSHRCSDAGICGMVSERQAGFASMTDAVGSEGIEEF